MLSESPTLPRPQLKGLLGGIFMHPRRTLQAVAEYNGQGWWLPALILIVLVIAVAVASGPSKARIAREQITQMQSSQTVPGAGQVDPQQLEQTLNFATSPVFTTVLPAATGAIGLVIGWGVQAGLLYLAATVLGGRTRFGAMWGVTLWAAIPFAMRSLLQTGYILFTNQIVQNPGLSGLAQTTSSDPLAALKISTGQRALVAGLGQVDLFVIWNLILLIVGLAAATHFSHRKAGLIVLGFWVLSVALVVLFTVATGSLAGGIVG
jgi:hypothetical protein